MKRYSHSVNMVNAPYLAKERGLDVREIRHEREGVYHTLLRVTVATSQGDRSVAGTLFGNDDAAPGRDLRHRHRGRPDGHMLYIVNEDAPGFIGRIGALLGEHGINIGTFHLGRRDSRRRGGAAAERRPDDPAGRDRRGRASWRA